MRKRIILTVVSMLLLIGFYGSLSFADSHGIIKYRQNVMKSAAGHMGAIVGLDGDIEHAAAILHPRFGKPVREAVEKGDDIIPSTKKTGGPGSVLVMPLTN